MKVLIIALPRSGSTSLMHKIAKEKNIKAIFEPFDGTNRVLYNGQNNVVVKTIICHYPDNIKLSKEFNEIILLSRKDVAANIESHAYQTYFSKTFNYNSNNPYVYKSPPEDIIKLCENDIIKWNLELKTLSNALNIPISYYEDLFDKNSNKRLRVNVNTNMGLI